MCRPVPSSLTPADSVTAWRAARPATGKLAPSAAETSGGHKTIKLSLATAYSASPPPVYHCKYNHKIATAKGRRKRRRMNTYRMIKHSYNFVPGFVICDSGSDLNNFSGYISSCTRRNQHVILQPMSKKGQSQYQQRELHYLLMI